MLYLVLAFQPALAIISFLAALTSSLSNAHGCRIRHERRPSRWTERESEAARLRVVERSPLDRELVSVEWGPGWGNRVLWKLKMCLVVGG